MTTAYEIQYDAERGTVALTACVGGDRHTVVVPAGSAAEANRAAAEFRMTYRDDGWPLCPRCGEDELYSLATYASIETIAGCYRCGRVDVQTGGSDA